MFRAFSLVVFSCAFVAPSSAQAASISTFAGTGAKGFSGDGGPAAAAQLNGPNGIARGPDGALYICDTENQRIRKVGAGGTITTFAGSGVRGFSGDGGPATEAALNEPYEVRFDARGNVFFVERLNHCVRRVDAQTGVISTVAGTRNMGFSGDGGPAIAAEMNEPHSIGFDRIGDLYICDVKNHRIRKVAMQTGVISTFAGTGEKKPTPDGAALAEAPLHGPRALDFDRGGNLWVALREGNAVFKIDPVTRTIQHIAGTGKLGFTGHSGRPKEATLSGPKGLAIASDGDVFLADTESHSIRRIDVKHDTIELVAGTGQKGDGSPGDPLACALDRPHGVFVDFDGALFIGDTNTHRVRVVRP